MVRKQSFHSTGNSNFLMFLFRLKTLLSVLISMKPHFPIENCPLEIFQPTVLNGISWRRNANQGAIPQTKSERFTSQWCGQFLRLYHESHNIWGSWKPQLLGLRESQLSLKWYISSPCGCGEKMENTNPKGFSTRGQDPECIIFQSLFLR